MQLYYTPTSHFARKLRILAKALALPMEFIDVGNVADNKADLFGPNPLMKVPSLVDGEQIVFESDHIAQYLVRHYAAEDRYRVLTDDVKVLNARAVMNGVMAGEVELLLAARTGLDTANLPRFIKIRQSMLASLSWLEQHVEIFKNADDYSAFHLVCMWDHLVFYKSLPLDFPVLEACVNRISALDYIAASAPH